MTPTLREYLDDVERGFVLSPVVLSCEVKEREERLQEGFIRIRGELSNGDFIEAFEFVVATPDEIQTLTYRIHWQGADGHLQQRWDNAPHHREVPTYPHHVHHGLAEEVAPSEPMSIQRALALIEERLSPGRDFPPG
jgi:hypothetical protein